LTDQLGRSAVPGWYEDPEAPDLLRWWDGTRWSDDAFRPKPTAEESANPFAQRARKIFSWALTVVVLFWIIPIILTLFPSYELQTLGVILAWLGALPALVLTALAIVFGAIGLSRSRQVDGTGRASALLGLDGGISLFAVPGLLALVSVAVMITIANI
jgi:hypothetical protein